MVGSLILYENNFNYFSRCVVSSDNHIQSLPVYRLFNVVYGCIEIR